MATFYVGYRPVLRGRNGNNNVNPYTGEAEVYSNWSIHNTDHILEGFPDNEVEVGVERPYSNTLLMEKLFAGHHNLAPMRDPGSGVRHEFGRQYLLGFQGLVGARVFPRGFGHVSRDVYYSNHTNFFHNGVTPEPLVDAGHSIRYDQDWGGAFAPYIYKGITDSALADAGEPVPEGHDGLYGHNKINEWKGVPSTSALR